MSTQGLKVHFLLIFMFLQEQKQSFVSAGNLPSLLTPTVSKLNKCTTAKLDIFVNAMSHHF